MRETLTWKPIMPLPRHSVATAKERTELEDLIPRTGKRAVAVEIDARKSPKA